MAHYDDLKNKAREVRNEVKAGANTATRVGTVLEGIVDALEAQANQDENIQENINELQANTSEKLKNLVVNDLTTGGADKALSAEMGKSVGEKLTELGSKVGLKIELNNQGYIDTNGYINAVETFSYSDYISVSKLDDVYLTGYSGSSSVANIAAYDKDKNFISALSAGNGGGKDMEKTTITEGVSYIIVSMANNTHKNYLPLSVTYRPNNETIARQKDVDRLKSLRGGLKILLTNEGFIGVRGEVSQTPTFSYSDYIPVTEGDEIVIEGWSGSTSVANIAAYDKDKKFIEALSVGNGGGKYVETTIIPRGVFYICVTMANDTHNKYKEFSANHIPVDISIARQNDVDSLYNAAFVSHNVAFNNVGYIQINDGSIKTDALTFSHSDFIKVEEGVKIKYYGYTGNPWYVSPIACYNNKKEFVSNLLEATYGVVNTEVIVPNDVNYIRVCAANDTHEDYVKPVVILTFTIGSELNTQILELKRLVGLIKDIDFSISGQYLAQNGTTGNNVNYVITPFLKVEEGDVLKYKGRIGTSFANICGYVHGYETGNDVTLLTGGTYNEEQTIIVPKGINYIRACADATSIEYSLTIIFKTSNREDTDSIPSLRGKKIAVIGDSISTINGKNTPYWDIKDIDVGKEIQSYVTWFDIYSDVDGSKPTGKTIGGILLTESMVGTLQTFTPTTEDVGKQIGVPLNYNSVATKVWSEAFCQKTGAVLLANASWSGSRITTHRTAKHYELSEAWSDFTISRCQKRNEDGSYETPDIIIIYRGTNDLSHKPYSSIDAVDLSNGFDAETDFVDGNYQFRIGYYKTIQKLRAKYPKAIIYCATLNVFKRVIYDKFPTRNGVYTLPQMNDVIRDIANTMGCGLIEFDKDGITFENCYSEGYITDSETIPTHPNSKGHEVMARKAISDITHTLVV